VSTSDTALKFGFVSPNYGKLLPPDQKARLGPWCAAGYNGIYRRDSTKVDPKSANTAAVCTDNTTLARGAASTPGGDPVTKGGGGTPYPRAVTENVLRVGQTSQPNAAALGDKGWITIFTSSMR